MLGGKFRDICSAAGDLPAGDAIIARLGADGAQAFTQADPPPGRAWILMPQVC